MRTIVIMVLLTTGLYHGPVFSQQIDPRIAKKFDASVVARIYDFSRYSIMSNEQQMALATLLHDKDSVTAAMIMSRRPLAEIDAYSEKINSEIYAIRAVRKYYDSANAAMVRLLMATEMKCYARYNPSPDCLYKIKGLVNKKYAQLALANLLYAAPAHKDSVQWMVNNTQDLLIEKELLADGAFVSSSLFSAAIKFRKALHATEQQTDSLLFYGMRLKQMRDSAYRINPLLPYDTKDYENYHLSTILNEEQFGWLLAMRYRPDALVNAEHDWNDLEKRGFGKGMNKTSTIAVLTDYYVRVKSSSNLYAYDLVKQSANARDVKDNMPKALRTLQYARKNNITNGNALNTDTQQ